MIFGRGKSIFHLDNKPVEPEDKKLRVRRRILILACVVALIFLTIPVLNRQEKVLKASELSHEVVRFLIESRTIASINRSTVRLNIGSEIARTVLVGDVDCSIKNSNTPKQFLAFENNLVKVLLGNKDGTDAREISAFCFHPSKGLTIENNPIEKSLLLLIGPETAFANNTFAEIHTVTMATDGSKIELLEREKRN